jgi:hypothetical protein
MISSPFLALLRIRKEVIGHVRDESHKDRRQLPDFVGVVDSEEGDGESVVNQVDPPLCHLMFDVDGIIWRS